MGAFNSPFSDIDNTKEGHLYVVDSNGWGWFALFILLALPLFILSLFLNKYALFVCQYPLRACLIYGCIAIAISLYLNHSHPRTGKFIRLFSTFLSLIPFAVVQAVYCIPYIAINEKLFAVAFEWILVTAGSLGVTILVIAVGRAIGNKWIYLLISFIFLGVVLYFINPPSAVTWADIIQLYQV